MRNVAEEVRVEELLYPLKMLSYLIRSTGLGREGVSG